MPNITIFDNHGERHDVDARSGFTLMQTILNDQIDGIVAECGGSCACGTCHCYVDESWHAKMPVMAAIEKETLECAIGIEATSRLSCQITLTDDMEGLVVRLPKSQI